jgi:hypothetical protein
VGDSGKAALGVRFADRERRQLVVSGRSDHTLTGAVELDTIHG